MSSRETAHTTMTTLPAASVLVLESARALISILDRPIVATETLAGTITSDISQRNPKP